MRVHSAPRSWGLRVDVQNFDPSRAALTGGPLMLQTSAGLVDFSGSSLILHKIPGVLNSGLNSETTAQREDQRLPSRRGSLLALQPREAQGAGLVANRDGY
jgi:hypothetical protein